MYNYEITLKNLTEDKIININLTSFFTDIEGNGNIIIQPEQEYKTRVLCENDFDCMEKIRTYMLSLNLIYCNDYSINLKVI